MSKFDAYQMVTDRICEALENGVKPWAMPWINPMNCGWSGQTGKPYSFLNQMLLAQPGKKYDSMEEIVADIRGEWLTFNQIQERGGKIKKGEHGRKVVFFKMIPEKGEDDQEDDTPKKTFPFLSVTTVFNVRQCEGIEAKYNKDKDQRFVFAEDTTAESVADDYLNRSGVTLVKVEGNRACYNPKADQVKIPLPEQFRSGAEYYSTLFHELTHSTGHESRLNRIHGNVHFGDESYSEEELVAEIGSASILSSLGIETDGSFVNSAAYIANWLSALKNDKRMIVKAAGKAEKAVKMILGMEVTA